MKVNIISFRLPLALAAGLAITALPVRAQDVIVNGSLSYVQNGSTFDYSLALNNTGSEAVGSLWLGWALSSNPVFDIVNPTNPGNNLGWNSVIDGNSVQYGSASDTPIASGHSGMFTFDSTSTPAQFMSQAAGQSVAYGVNAMPFTIEDNSLDSVEFALQVVPEPSTLGLFALGSIALLGGVRRKLFGR